MDASGQPKRYLVTGGAGFIGSNLVEALLAQGGRVRVFDNFATGRRENLSDFADDVEIIEGDLRDPEAVATAVREVDVVFHEAALGSVPRSLADPSSTHASNATGTLNVLTAARASGVERVIYAGSSSAYGDAEKLPVDESMPSKPLSPYAVAKLAGENYLRAFNIGYGMFTTTLRYFNVFGPRQDPGSQYAAVVPLFITAALEGRPATIFGDGEQARDFTYVADVVAANLLAAEAPPEASGRTFNVAASGPHSILELWKAVQDACGGEPVDPEFAPARTGDVRNSYADITAAREILGFVPAHSFESGIEGTVAWLKEHPSWVG